ncbi:MAG TPA: class I SAM-dependent methyltransferase [Candidatus Omnitrophota bacterium]|nr:class I SAM-dependent methyltransferase [Candidatus Omnitrophota bacterium]
MTKINCIFCDIPSEKVVAEENGFTAVECPACKLVYISCPPDKKELQELYTRDHAHVSAQGHIADTKMPRWYEKHHLKILRRFKKSGSILEIGPGGGTFLEEARSAGFKVFAVEPNPAQAEYITHTLHIPCEATDICNSSFPNKSFDIIYHRDVTGHFYDPIAAFTKMRALLNDTGVLVFETGFYGEDRYMPLFMNHQFPDHLFTFSEKSIQHLLSRSGFSTIASYRYSSVPVLFFRKLMQPLLDSLKSKTSKSSSPHNGSSRTNNTILLLLKGLHFTICHFLRYKVGSIASKKGRPQKMILIAQKVPDIQ